MGAVQNAMQRDGLDPTIMDLDHNKSVASQLKKEEDDEPPLKEDPKYQKYFKVRCFVALNWCKLEFTHLSFSLFCFQMLQMVRSSYWNLSLRTSRQLNFALFLGSSNGCCSECNAARRLRSNYYGFGSQQICRESAEERRRQWTSTERRPEVPEVLQGVLLYCTY
jgi:hypothetical protein